MHFSWINFGLLAIIAVGTVAMVELLSRRYTRWRRYFKLRDFADENKLRLVRDGQLPTLLPQRVSKLARGTKTRWHFADDGMAILRLQTDQQTYNLILFALNANWPATAFRPSSQPTTLMERLELFSYPSAYGTQRFTLHGVDPAASRKLSESRCRALLPSDLSLMLEGSTLMIDFSSRPFDPIEFGRMIALIRQIATAVPPL